MSPRNATTSRRSGKRFYTWRNENYWSVTTILSGGVPKPALINWAKKFTAEYACENIVKLNALLEPDGEGVVDSAAAIDWLKGAAYRSRDAAADLGTLIHDATEAYVLGKPFPPVPKKAEPRMDGFKQFLADCSPHYEATEASVYNRSERYAGTLDAIAEIHGRKYLIDTKTGKAVYPEVALQLAAYRHAEFIGLPDGSEGPMPAVDSCAALHLPEEGGSYELVQVRADDEIFKAFLYVREVFRWQEQTSKSAIMGPLTDLGGDLAQASIPLANALEV